MAPNPSGTRIPPNIQASNNPPTPTAWTHYGFKPGPTPSYNPNPGFNPAYDPQFQRELGDYEDEDESWFVDSESSQSQSGDHQASPITPRAGTYTSRSFSGESYPNDYRGYRDPQFDGEASHRAKRGFAPPPAHPQAMNAGSGSGLGRHALSAGAAPIHYQTQQYGQYGASRYGQNGYGDYGDGLDYNSSEQDVRPWAFPEPSVLGQAPQDTQQARWYPQSNPPPPVPPRPVHTHPHPQLHTQASISSIHSQSYSQQYHSLQRRTSRPSTGGGIPSSSSGASGNGRPLHMQHRASKSELGPIELQHRPLPSLPHLETGAPSSGSSGPSGNLHREVSGRLYRSPSGLSIRSGNISFTTTGTVTQESGSPSPSTLSHELSNLTLDWETNLTRFQSDELNPSDEEWHRLVSTEAREALGKKEVQRQSVIFEVIKSEKDYVKDLLVIREVFINPLIQSNIVSQQYVRGFCKEVFYNLDEILRHHQRMLAALFERQRDQHPLVQSVADIILDNVLRFRSAYESYIKHYPLSEAQHRRELRRNTAYHSLMQRCLSDPRTRKRDLITFISRPVTRLPRLNLLLEQIQKLSESDHPDRDQLPVIEEILSEFIKSTQPGIAAAESKVKFWSLVESLSFRAGERIDMDIYNENRTLIRQGTLSRRQRSETDWHGWHDLEVALLDNYLLLCRKEAHKSGVRHIITSRPIPLEYLRLGNFDGPSESRKMKSNDGGALSALSFHYEPYFPFTIYHASSKGSRRYTLFAANEKLRDKWKMAFRDALTIRRVQQESNMLYVLDTLNDGFFKIRNNKATGEPKTVFTGRITAAATFRSARRGYYIAATGHVIHGTTRGEQEAKPVLKLPNVQRMSVLQQFNKLILQCDLGVLAYSLDLLAKAINAQSSSESSAISLLEASMERVTPKEENVQFFRTGVVSDRTLVMYTSKRSFMQTNVHALEVLSPDAITRLNSRGRNNTTGEDARRSFRSFGSPFYVPKDAFEITILKKTMAISTEKGLTIVDPTHLAQGRVASIPDFTNASTEQDVTALKAKCEAARALGIVQSGESELMIIYDDFGCYVTKHGLPCRKCEIIRWETPAASYSYMNGHVILISREFIEIRDVATGRLVQVMEGQDFRLVQSIQNGAATGSTPGSLITGCGDKPLIAVRGETNVEEGYSDALMEMIETAPLDSTNVNALTDGRDSVRSSIQWE